MARLLWLADVLRGAGLTVHEYAGWRTRGYDPSSNPFGPVRGIICHATAGSRTSTDAAETRVLWVTGSSSAPAPISQLYLSRTGAWWVGASGRCNHVKIGDKGPHKGYGNDALVGVEAQNDNRGEPWPAVQLDSYQRGVAAIARRLGLGASTVVAHREHQSDKSDPYGVDMATFRRHVAAVLAGEDEDMATPDEVAHAVWWRDVSSDEGAQPAWRMLESLGKAVPALDVRLQRIEAALAAVGAVTDEQAAAMAERIGALLVAAPDVPLGEQDMPAIREALRQVLLQGAAAATSEPASPAEG